eukprot:UN05530
MPHVGDVMTIDDKKVDPNPPQNAESFKALVFVQDHPGKLQAAHLEKIKITKHATAKHGDNLMEGDDMVYKGGFTPSIHIRTAKAPCQMIKILWKMGKSTNNTKVDNPKFIEAGDQAEVIFHNKLPIVVQSFDECKPLGRIAAMDSNSLIMLGKVTQVTYKKLS